MKNLLLVSSVKNLISYVDYYPVFCFISDNASSQNDRRSLRYSVQNEILKYKNNSSHFVSKYQYATLFELGYFFNKA